VHATIGLGGRQPMRMLAPISIVRGVRDSERSTCERESLI
jgi:hypothetical protein